MKKTIKDYISGQEIKATPEEIESVQILSKQIVEDYKYPKEYIQTRPQWKIKTRPSDTKRNYPIDIAIFNGKEHTEDNLYIIAECKRKNRKDGISQLKDYLRFSNAEFGIWFNGEKKIFIRKIIKKDGIEFKTIPDIPKYKQRIEDVGMLKRKDLKSTHNFKIIFKSIRNFLAANAVGTTRDEVLAQQIINLIFCKIYDEKYTKPDEIVNFRIGINEDIKEVKNRIEGIFENVKKKYNDVFDEKDKIGLDANSIAYVVSELQNFCLLESDRDAIAEAFETFIGQALKGSQGQFFTPKNVINFMVNALNIGINDNVIDPACGSGGFLIESLKNIYKKIDKQSKELNWSNDEVVTEKLKVAYKIKGIEKDSFLTKIAKVYLTIVSNTDSNIFCEDALENPINWSNTAREKIKLNSFDIVLSNPPFGVKIPVVGKEKLKQFKLAYKWKKNKITGKYEKTNILKEKEVPQILFIERNIQLLKDGGKMAIILPEGIFGNPSDRYIWDYIKQQGNIIGIISFPIDTFLPNTAIKTSVLIFEKGKPQQDKIFMAIAKKVGHNKNGKNLYKMNNDGTYKLDENGNKIIDDDIPVIIENFNKFINNKLDTFNHLGFVINSNNIKDNIYIPKYYNPEIEQKLENLKNKGYTLVQFKELVDKGIVEIKRGNEIGSIYYGLGDVPFVRTSDIVDWSIKDNVSKKVPYEIYLNYKDKQDIKEGDILFVKDGGELVGNTALITKENEVSIIQSHLLKIRVKENKKNINSFYLMYLLNLPIVREQIKNKTFIQGTIPSLGDRLNEVILPIKEDEIDKNTSYFKNILNKIKSINKEKKKLKEQLLKDI